jgi:hypothetical protein
MACAQCEWEIFRTGRYEPSLQGRRKSSIAGRRPSGITKSSSFDVTGARGGARRSSAKVDQGLGSIPRGDNIATRIYARRRSLDQSHDTSQVERHTGDIIQQAKIQWNSTLILPRQSVCQICSLDLRPVLEFLTPFSPHSPLENIQIPILLSLRHSISMKMVM